jgi:hypothetical protein
MNSLAAARPDMIATLGSFRHTLEVSEAHSASLIQFQLALNVKVSSVNPGGAQVSGWSSRHMRQFGPVHRKERRRGSRVRHPASVNIATEENTLGMNKKLSTLTGRRDDPFPGRLNLCLEDRSLVHVLSGLRSSDLALPLEAQTIEARQRFLSATFCSIAIVFDGLDEYQCDEPDIGPDGFDATVLGGLWSLCSQLYPTILTRYDDSAHQAMEAHLDDVLEGNAVPLIIFCPEHRRADWQTWFEAKKAESHERH